MARIAKRKRAPEASDARPRKVLLTCRKSYPVPQIRDEDEFIEEASELFRLEEEFSSSELPAESDEEFDQLETSFSACSGSDSEHSCVEEMPLNRSLVARKSVKIPQVRAEDEFESFESEKVEIPKKKSRHLEVVDRKAKLLMQVMDLVDNLESAEKSIDLKVKELEDLEAAAKEKVEVRFLERQHELKRNRRQLKRNREKLQSWRNIVDSYIPVPGSSGDFLDSVEKDVQDMMNEEQMEDIFTNERKKKTEQKLLVLDSDIFNEDRLRNLILNMIDNHEENIGDYLSKVLTEENAQVWAM